MHPLISRAQPSPLTWTSSQRKQLNNHLVKKLDEKIQWFHDLHSHVYFPGKTCPHFRCEVSLATLLLPLHSTEKKMLPQQQPSRKTRPSFHIQPVARCGHHTLTQEQSAKSKSTWQRTKSKRGSPSTHHRLQFTVMYICSLAFCNGNLELSPLSPGCGSGRQRPQELADMAARH
jgi:hypothetical protein